MAEIGECVSPMKAPLFLAPDLEFYYLLFSFRVLFMNSICFCFFKKFIVLMVLFGILYKDNSQAALGTVQGAHLSPLS